MKIALVSLASVCVSIIALGLVFANLARAEIGAEDVVGIWLFDDEEEGKVALDSSDNGHHGEIKDGIVWTEGKFGGALEFPGLDGVHVEVPPVEALTLTTFTITAWVNMEMVVDRLRDDEKGNEVITYKFRPVADT